MMLSRKKLRPGFQMWSGRGAIKIVNTIKSSYCSEHISVCSKMIDNYAKTLSSNYGSMGDAEYDKANRIINNLRGFLSIRAVDIKNFK